MAWKSDTFKKSPAADKPTEKKAAISEAAHKHNPAISTIIKNAQRLAAERRTTLSQIKDPGLKRSASR